MHTACLTSSAILDIQATVSKNLRFQLCYIYMVKFRRRPSLCLAIYMSWCVAVLNKNRILFCCVFRTELRAHMHFIDASNIHVFTRRVWAPPLAEVQHCRRIKHCDALQIPYSAYISRIFNFANFANFEPFAKLFQRKFWHYTLNLHVGDVEDGSISVFQEGGWKLSREQATWSTRSALEWTLVFDIRSK